MGRILNQAANAAAKLKGSIFEILCRRCVPRLGHNQTIGIIAHKLCRLVWKILPRGIRYEERGPRGPQSVQAKAHPKNDPRTPQAWFPNRTDPFSISHHTVIAVSNWHDFRPCVGSDHTIKALPLFLDSTDSVVHKSKRISGSESNSATPQQQQESRVQKELSILYSTPRCSGVRTALMLILEM